MGIYTKGGENQKMIRYTTRSQDRPWANLAGAAVVCAGGHFLIFFNEKPDLCRFVGVPVLPVVFLG